MSRIGFISLALVLTASACVTNNGDDEMGGGGGSGSGSGSGGGGGGGGGEVAPHEGRWFYAETTLISSNCPSTVDQGSPGEFAIENSTLAGFTVVPEDGTAPFACALTGSSYDCPDRATYVQDFRPTFDAVLTVRATAAGAFSSATRATGQQDAIASCQGTQCASIGGAALPCTFTVDYVVRAF